MLKKLELKEKNHLFLKKYCDKKIDFMSTAYDIDSAKFLNKLGVKIFKTAQQILLIIKCINFYLKQENM